MHGILILPHISGCVCACTHVGGGQFAESFSRAGPEGWLGSAGLVCERGDERKKRLQALRINWVEMGPHVEMLQEPDLAQASETETSAREKG